MTESLPKQVDVISLDVKDDTNTDTKINDDSNDDVLKASIVRSYAYKNINENISDYNVKLAKCLLSQWLVMLPNPNPQTIQMWIKYFNRFHSSLNVNDDMLDSWMKECNKILNIAKNNENNNSDIPDWFTMQDGFLGDSLLKRYNIKELSIQDRCLGCMLSIFCGDCLGAAVEGWDYDSITNKYATKIINFIPGTHMGVRNQGARLGMYTDDTMTTLALALSIVKNNGLNAKQAALEYGNFFLNNPYKRGLPVTAKKVLTDVQNGMSIFKSGVQSFKDGSFANGGAMRISSIGLCFRF